MRKFFQIGVTSLVLSAFVVAPTVVIVTADTAIAKSDNAGGKGKGGGNRGKGKGKGNDGGKGKSDNAGKGGGKGNGNGLSNGKKYGKSSFAKSTTGKGKNKAKGGKNGGFESAGKSIAHFLHLYYTHAYLSRHTYLSSLCANPWQMCNERNWPQRH